MNERKSMGLIFIFSLMFTIVLLLVAILNIDLILSVSFYQMILVITFMSFIIFFISFRKFIAEVKYDIDEKKDKEKNVRDYYNYLQLLDPPYNNN